MKRYGGVEEYPRILSLDGRFVQRPSDPPPDSLPLKKYKGKHAEATDKGVAVLLRTEQAGRSVAAHWNVSVFDVVKVRVRVRSADVEEYHRGPVAVDILEAFLGAIYRRSYFDHAVLTSNRSFPLACHTTDDIVFGAHLASRGIPRIKLPMPFPRPTETAADKVAPLRADNVGGASKNDFCAATLLSDLQTWPWREQDRRPCAVSLEPLPLPPPLKVEAAFTARADYANETRSPCNLDTVALSTLPRPCATVTSIPLGGALLPDQLLISADFPLPALGLNPEDRHHADTKPFAGLPLLCRGSKGGSGGGGVAGQQQPWVMDKTAAERGDVCILWHNNDTRTHRPFVPMSASQEAALKKKRPKLPKANRKAAAAGAVELGVDPELLVKVRAGLQNGLPPAGAYILWNHDHGQVTEYQRFGADLSDAASCRPAGWGEWLSGTRGARKVWEVRRPLRFTPKPFMKYPVQQRSVVAVTDTGALELRPGLPWAAPGSAFFSTESQLSSDFSAHGSLPPGYHAVLRLHRSGLLCVLAEPKPDHRVGGGGSRVDPPPRYFTSVASR
jgi:hypothetical protein